MVDLLTAWKVCCWVRSVPQKQRAGLTVELWVGWWDNL
jgi:hypothetical protein